ncbi:MAG: CdaR family protein [Dehalococcoidia bacterium]
MPGALLFIGRGAITSVIGNLSLAALALALAVSLWLYVTERENPTTERTFNKAIPITYVNVPNDLAVSQASASTVSIRIEAPENEFEGLDVDDFEATVDLGGLTVGRSGVPVDVAPPNGRVNVVSTTPAQVDVTLEPRRSRDVPVRVEIVGSPQTGFAAANTNVQPDSATVTGPESLVALVDSVVAEVNLTGARVDVTEDRVALEPRDARDGALSRVTVSPSTASVDVDLEQREFSSPFVVSPVIAGNPAAGFNVADISVQPAIVTISGSLEVLQSIDAVRGVLTEEISIADARDDVRRTVQLQLPPGARLQGNPTIEVAIDIEPGSGEFTFLVVPQIANVGDGLFATPAEPVAVTLAGDVSVLGQLTAQSIVVSADAQGLDEGLHVLPLQVTPPGNTSVIRVEPGELGVALTRQ